MKVENTKFVAVNYTLTVDGQVADKNPEGQPLEFVCGAGMLLPKFEGALIGKEPGDKVSFTLEPKDGYGELIAEAINGEADNVVANAPHIAEELAGEWSHPYSRYEAAFPLAWVARSKFFPYVSKIDNGYGDRNLVCVNNE